MGNSIFLDLNLRENLRPAFRKLGLASDQVFGKLGKQIFDTQKGLNNLGGTEYKLKVDSSGLERAGREADKLHQKMSGIGGGGSTWSMFKGSFAARGVERGLDAAIDFAKQSFEAGADAEQQMVGLATFVGKKRAKELYDQVQRQSAETPFATSDILPGLLQLISSGQTPEKAMKDLWALQNALSATGNAGNSFMLSLTGSHLAQMASVGKADAMFMKEFQRTAHIPMTRLLSEYMFPKNVKGGMKQISEWTENGDLKDHVTYDTFVAALDRASQAGGMFAGAIEAQSKTIRGKGSTIRDWWNIGMAKAVLDPKTHDNIIRLEDRLIKGLEQFPELIGRMSPVVNKLFESFDELWPNIKDFGLSAVNLLKPIGGVLMSDELKNLGKTAFDIAKDITDLLGPAVKEFASHLTWAADKIYKGFHLGETWTQGVKDLQTVGNPTNKNGFMWAGLNDSMAVDSVRYKKMVDSVGASNIFTGSAAFMNYLKGLGANVQGRLYNLTMPYKNGLNPDEQKTPGAENHTASTEMSDSITRGGGKSIYINFRNFAENVVNNIGTKDEAMAMNVRDFRHMLAQVLAGVPGF